MKVAQHEVLGRRSNKRYVPDDPSVLALAALRARRKAERFDRPWRGLSDFAGQNALGF
jgi:hypothetical protein